jgi:quercetin dioxygenase-like cupin family protein
MNDTRYTGDDEGEREVKEGDIIIIGRESKHNRSG